MQDARNQNQSQQYSRVINFDNIRGIKMEVNFSLKRHLLIYLALSFSIIYQVSAQSTQKSTILSVNYQKLISRADIQYDKQVQRSEEGLPIGNGTMGSLVWTTPKQIRLQINRVDVFAADRTTNSFPEVDTDYAHGCAFVDIEVADFGPDAFPAEKTKQHLSVYDGVLTIVGNGITAKLFAWPDGDVMAIRITDNRENPASIRATLRSLRTVTYHQRNHYAFTRLASNQGSILLRQQFVEGDDFFGRWQQTDEQEASVIDNRTFYCGSSVALSVSGRQSQVRELNDQAIQLAIEPGNGTVTIFIASASSYDFEEDVNGRTLIEKEKAVSLGVEKLELQTKDWWHRFWSESFLHLTSKDGEAEYVEKHYSYFLYLMASSSRGAYPPRYGGMLWNTGGDVRLWGSMKWMYNLFCYYNNVLLTANKIEITNPSIEMFHKNYQAMSLAAEQQVGSKGVYIQETMWFNGPDSLPDNIATEMRDLYLVRKPFSQASEKFLEYAASKNAFDSRWSWKHFDVERWINGKYFWEPRPTAPYTYVLHLFASGAKIAYFHWLRYDYTQDKEWLRQYGYPIIKGVAEFYRNYPNVKKEQDGKYHIHGVNNWESAWGSSDTIEELAGMRATTATAIRASEILGIDDDMRPVWQEFLDNITPLPTAPDTSQVGNPEIWVTTIVPALPDALPGRNTIMRRSTTPITSYDMFTLESNDPELIKLAKNTYKPSISRQSGSQGVGWLSKAAKTAATMGDAEAIKMLVLGQIKYHGLKNGHPEIGVGWGSNWRGPLGNRMSLAEGRQAMGAQRIGNAVEGLVLALCRATAPGPAAEAVIRVFPAWPKDWDASYTLLTRGNFLVTSSIQNENIEFIEVKSQSGGECRIRNPWGDQIDVSIIKNDSIWKDMSGSLIKFETRKGDNFVIIPKGSSPEKFKRTILEE
jgi:hypothetical protein